MTPLSSVSGPSRPAALLYIESDWEVQSLRTVEIDSSGAALRTSGRKRGVINPIWENYTSHFGLDSRLRRECRILKRRRVDR